MSSSRVQDAAVLGAVAVLSGVLAGAGVLWIRNLSGFGPFDLAFVVLVVACVLVARRPGRGWLLGATMCGITLASVALGAAWLLLYAAALVSGWSEPMWPVVAILALCALLSAYFGAAVAWNVARAPMAEGDVFPFRRSERERERQPVGR